MGRNHGFYVFIASYVFKKISQVGLCFPDIDFELFSVKLEIPVIDDVYDLLKESCRVDHLVDAGKGWCLCLYKCERAHTSS